MRLERKIVEGGVRETPAGHFETYYHRGLDQVQHQEYAKAVRSFDKEIELNPRHVQSYCHRAISSSRRGHYNVAIKYYDKAISLDAEVASGFITHIAHAYFQKGIARKEFRSYKRAIENFEIAGRLNSELEEEASKEIVSILSIQGLRCLKRKRFGLAKEYLDKALALAPDEPRLYSYRGDLFTSMGHQEKAIEEYTNALDINSGYGVVLDDRGGAKRSLLLTHVVFGEKVTPKSSDYVNSAITYLDEGKIAKAIAYSSKAIELDPKNTIAYNNRGMLYGRIGDYRQALTDFETALRIDPHYEKALQNRQVAQQKLRREEVQQKDAHVNR